MNDKGTHRRAGAWGVLIFSATFLGSVGLAHSVLSQTVNAPNPVANFGASNTSSETQAQQRVSGIDAQLTFEASQPLERTTTTLRTTPDVVAPSIVGGNPCVISASLGGSVVGFGIAGGVGIEDADCETRQTAALMANMGDKSMGFMHLCMQNDEAKASIMAAGYPSCLAYAQTMNGQKPSTVSYNAEPTPVSAAGARQVVQPPATTQPISMSLAAHACSDSDYAKWKRSDASWSEWPAGCKARHTQ